MVSLTYVDNQKAKYVRLSKQDSASALDDPCLVIPVIRKFPEQTLKINPFRFLRAIH
jgi:hypothetical protein